MSDPQLPARLANQIGKHLGLSCRYEWDRKKQTFAYHFYRRHLFLGSVVDPTKVIAKMERYASTK